MSVQNRSQLPEAAFRRSASLRSELSRKRRALPLATHDDLAQRLDQREWRESERDGKVQYVFETIQHLIEAPEPEQVDEKRRIGFPVEPQGRQVSAVSGPSI